MRINRSKLVLSLTIAALAGTIAQAVNAEEPDSKRGKQLFMSHCSKCHSGGQNNVKPSKPIVGSSVTATYATFKAYLNKPIGTMPHYEHLITDDEALQSLYSYVKTLDADDSASPPGKGGDKAKKSSARSSKDRNKAKARSKSESKTKSSKDSKAESKSKSKSESVSKPKPEPKKKDDAPSTTADS